MKEKSSDNTLSEYGTSIDMYDDYSLPIISGYSFAFTNINKGQYGDNYDNLEVFIFLGIWCLIFTIPSFFILKQRHKPPLPKTSSIFTISIRSYWISIKTATCHPNLFKTLIAWYLYSDALNTIGSIGILFAQNELGLNGIYLIILLLQIQLLAAIGNILFVWISDKFNLTSKNLLIVH